MTCVVELLQAAGVLDARGSRALPWSARTSAELNKLQAFLTRVVRVLRSGARELLRAAGVLDACGSRAPE